MHKYLVVVVVVVAYATTTTCIGNTSIKPII